MPIMDKLYMFLFSVLAAGSLIRIVVLVLFRVGICTNYDTHICLGQSQSHAHTLSYITIIVQCKEEEVYDFKIF